MTYKECCKHIDKLVNTDNGIGILINKKTENNGLYFEPERTEWLIWFGTDHPKRGKWICRPYNHKDINKVTIIPKKIAAYFIKANRVR